MSCGPSHSRKETGPSTSATCSSGSSRLTKQGYRPAKMQLVDPTSDLRLLLVSRHPLIVVRVDDEARFLGVLRRAATDAGMHLWTWSAARGFASDGLPPQPSTADITAGAELRGRVDGPVGLRVPRRGGGARRREGGPPAEGVRARGTGGPDDRADGSRSHDPGRSWTASLCRGRSNLPTCWRSRRSCATSPTSWSNAGSRSLSTTGALAALTEAVRGISLPEAERLILREAMAEGGLDREDVADIREAKAELLADDGVLELVPTDARGLDCRRRHGSIEGLAPDPWPGVRA